MEFIKDAEITTSDFWYDVFEGGYIKPAKLLKSLEDVQRVQEAINTLREFHNSAEEAEVINYL